LAKLTMALWILSVYQNELKTLGADLERSPKEIPRWLRSS
jgi:hypothetical protein